MSSQQEVDQTFSLNIETLRNYKITDIDTHNKIREIRRRYYEFSKILKELPPGRSRSISQQHLEDSELRAVQALVIEYGEPIE